MTTPTSDLWMRPVSFAGLHRILHLLAEHRTGLPPGELDRLVARQGAYQTLRGTTPKRATRYHCRNTLLRIGAVAKVGPKLYAATDVPEVIGLLDGPPPPGPELSTAACDLFASLVLRTSDCRRRFFDLFMPGTPEYGVGGFRAAGRTVVWSLPPDSETHAVLLESGDRTMSMVLQTPAEIKSIVHGVRYWARDELALVDEVFQQSRGVTMFPLKSPRDAQGTSVSVGEVLGLVDSRQEWTTLAVADLIAELCMGHRRPVRHLFGALRNLMREHAGEVIAVPTSRAFATLTAQSMRAEQLHLRSYLQDGAGRYISHLMVHRSLREAA